MLKLLGEIIWLRIISPERCTSRNLEFVCLKLGVWLI